MPMQNPERVVTKQDLKDFYDEIYPYLGGSSSSGVSETMIAPVESDATSASKAYEIGDQLILGGVLYTATAAISIGDPLTVGTNIAASDDITTQIADIDITTDATPTKNSTHAVQSGGVYNSEKAIREIVAPVEEDATSASQAYAIGEYLILNGILYKAKTAISSTDALVVGTNIELADDVETQIASKANTADLGTAAAKDSTNAVTQSSTDLVESGAVYTALSGKADASDLGTAAAKDSTNAVAQSSTDLVESGAVYDALANKADASALNDKEDAPTVLTSTLAASATSITFTDDSIGSNSRIRAYSNPFVLGLITNMTQSSTSVTLTCEPQSSSVSIKLEVRN